MKGTNKQDGAASEFAAMSPFDSLPEEVALKIVKMVATKGKKGWGWEVEYDHDFLVYVLCKVSVRFKELGTDYSIRKGRVWVHPPVARHQKDRVRGPGVPQERDQPGQAP